MDDNSHFSRVCYRLPVSSRTVQQNKAVRLAAEQHALLTLSKVPPSIKHELLKDMAPDVQYCTKAVQRPFLLGRRWWWEQRRWRRRCRRLSCRRRFHARSFTEYCYPTCAAIQKDKVHWLPPPAQRRRRPPHYDCPSRPNPENDYQVGLN